jgi:hypothetical protein
MLAVNMNHALGVHILALGLAPSSNSRIPFGFRIYLPCLRTLSCHWDFVAVIGVRSALQPDVSTQSSTVVLRDSPEAECFLERRLARYVDSALQLNAEIESMTPDWVAVGERLMDASGDGEKMRHGGLARSAHDKSLHSSNPEHSHVEWLPMEISPGD